MGDQRLDNRRAGKRVNLDQILPGVSARRRPDQKMAGNIVCEFPQANRAGPETALDRVRPIAIGTKTFLNGRPRLRASEADNGARAQASGGRKSDDSLLR